MADEKKKEPKPLGPQKMTLGIWVGMLFPVVLMLVIVALLFQSKGDGENDARSPFEFPLTDTQEGGSLKGGDNTEPQSRKAVRGDMEASPERTKWNYTKGQKSVYLTFDGGPSNVTGRILDTLDQCNVKATFFVCYHNPEYADVIAEAASRGHSIGMLTYSNRYDVCYTSEDAYFADLNRLGEKLKEKLGYVPFLIRFPGGSSNEGSREYCEGIMSRLSGQVIERGYQYWDWNVNAGDAAPMSADEIVEKVFSETEGDNIVLLLHDGEGKETTAEALKRIIEGFDARGYSFAAIDRETLVVHERIRN